MSNNFCQINSNLCNHEDPNVVAFYTQVCGMTHCSQNQSLNYPTVTASDNIPTPMMTESSLLSAPLVDNIRQFLPPEETSMTPVQTSMTPVQTSMRPMCTDNPKANCARNRIDFNSKPDYYSQNCCNSYKEYASLISRNATQKPFTRIKAQYNDFTKLTHDPNMSYSDPPFCTNDSLGSIDNVCNNYSNRCPNTCKDYNNNSLLQNRQPVYDQNMFSSWNQ